MFLVTKRASRRSFSSPASMTPFQMRLRDCRSKHPPALWSRTSATNGRQTFRSWSPVPVAKKSRSACRRSRRARSGKFPIRLLAVSRPGAEDRRLQGRVDRLPGRIEPLDSRTVSSPRWSSPAQTRKVTFRSEIDDTVQFYGLVPSSAPPPAAGDPSPAASA